MARRTKKESAGSSGREREETRDSSVKLSLFQQIEALASRDARYVDGERQPYVFLMNWWSVYYQRPLKDPILQQYTLEELAYEYYLVKHSRLAEQERIEAEADRMDEEKWKAEQEWADRMEEEERLEEELAETDGQPAVKNSDPALDPESMEWMEKHIQLEKEQLGEEFGEDLNIDFGKE